MVAFGICAEGSRVDLSWGWAGDGDWGKKSRGCLDLAEATGWMVLVMTEMGMGGGVESQESGSTMLHLRCLLDITWMHQEGY